MIWLHMYTTTSRTYMHTSAISRIHMYTTSAISWLTADTCVRDWQLTLCVSDLIIVCIFCLWSYQHLHPSSSASHHINICIVCLWSYHRLHLLSLIISTSASFVSDIINICILHRRHHVQMMITYDDISDMMISYHRLHLSSASFADDDKIRDRRWWWW